MDRREDPHAGGAEGRHGRGVDERGGGLLDELGDGVLAEEEDTLQVHLEHAVPVLFIGLHAGREGSVGTGVVVDHVEPAEPVERVLDRPPHVVRLADVA